MSPRLVHLTAVGPSVEPASIEFGSTLTVVYGTSDTGKSYVGEAIDFMLGAKTLRQVPEASRYTRMLLGLQLADGSEVTLARPLSGGRFEAFEEDLRELPTRPADRFLAARHSERTDENVSTFFLNELGLAGAKIRRNRFGTLQNLSLRNLMHLCLVDETRMQAKGSPVQTGNYATRTAERAALKVLLEGEDDSGLTDAQDPVQFRRVNKGKVEVLDQAISQMRAHLDGVPPREELEAQLLRVTERTGELTANIDQALAERDERRRTRDGFSDVLRSQRGRATEAGVLSARFGLLRQQYESDLERLTLVRQAGTFLGYFSQGACVFCGADPEHQTINHVINESTELATSVDAEVAKTEALRADLDGTLSDLADEAAQLQESIHQLATGIAEHDAVLSAQEQALAPRRGELTELLTVRSSIEHSLSNYDRLAELEDLRSSVASETVAPPERVGAYIAVSAVQEFSAAVKQVLQAWQLPGAASASFVAADPPDVYLDDRPRADRGKGMRSVLHAGFSVTLSQFCLERELPHPGFVILDTPVLTYREPDMGPTADDIADEAVSLSVQESFYSYLQAVHVGQAVVIENVTPPAIDASGCRTIEFTGQSGVGRFGFYPG